MRPSEELYTPATLYTLGGTSMAVMILTSVVQKAGIDPWWIGLLFAEVLALAGLSTLPADHWEKHGRLGLVMVAFCNGLLIYSQATGINAIDTGIKSPPAAQATALPFLDAVPWWPPADQTQAARDAADALRIGAQATEQAAATLTNLTEPLQQEINRLDQLLAQERSNREATLKGLQAGGPVPAERQALERNLIQLEATIRDTEAMQTKLRAAAGVIDPTVATVLLKPTRDRLMASEASLVEAAARLERAWAPVWESAPFEVTRTTSPTTGR